MFCAKCGTEISEGSKFCAKCGAPVAGVVAAETNAEKNGNISVPIAEAQPTVSEVQPAVKEGKKSGKLPIVPFAAGAAVLLLAVAVGVGGFFLFRGKENSGAADRTSGENGSIMNDNTVGNREDAPVDWWELEPLYTIDDVPTIEIYEHNYVAGAKAPGIAWDSTLFYWLEDIDQTSSEDGYLARCTITKMVLRSAYSGELIQYEIYRDPQTDEIYKIVSIEHEADSIRLVDYYYQGGVPNFTFYRHDSVYTPTYATPAKTGERYYFNSDVMARWRMIQEPNVIEEYVLAPSGASYAQTDYFAESADFQAVYDDIELREINAARNTYDAVTAAGNGIGLVEGRVTDTAGNPVAGVTVDILRGEDGVLLYRAVTGEDGSFRIFVYLEDVECSIIVRGNDTFDSNNVQGVMLARATGGSTFGNLLLHRLDGDEYPVHINVYAAADVRTGEDGSLLRELLPGAKVSLRAGAGARTGEILQTLEADGEGKVNTTLPAGTYTAQIDVAGYASAYVTVEVAEKETTAEGYVLPMPEADQKGIVLTWEGEADLDLTLFTPYQSTNGDMAHIGGRITDDGYGNRLVADNASGCEVMYVNTAVLGNYKLYVNNYTESEAGNYSSAQLSTLNIHIYIYDSTGLIGEYSFPAGEIGVVWEVADLNGSQVTPSQRVYISLEGKNWWTENKEKLVLVQKKYYNSDGSIWDWHEYNYDAMGNRVKEIWYNSDGNIYGWYEYSYDTEGNLVQEINYNTDGSIGGWVDYSYDTAGNLVQKSDHNMAQYDTRTEYSYDAMGNMVMEVSYTSNGSIEWRGEYSYDAMGNQVKETYYGSDGSMGSWYEYSYDAMGNQVKAIYYFSDGSIGDWYEYSYDAMGNQVKETYYSADGSLWEWYEYSYDAMGNQVKAIYYFSDGSTGAWNEYSYDAMGNQVKETHYFSDGSMGSWYEYSYAPLNAR